MLSYNRRVAAAKLRQLSQLARSSPAQTRNLSVPSAVAGSSITSARVVTASSVGSQSWRGYATAAPVTPASLLNATTKKPLFDKILIANRGEIACRVMKTAQALGIKCVAVFSEADRYSMHVKMADEAYLLGPAPSSESYLRSDKIVEICKLSGAQAVHPGYGFLSESHKFSQLLADNGIVFIGPPASAIISMGSKSESKDIMLRAGVPCVPGWHPSSDSPASTQLPEFLILEADKIGYPVLIKAVSGGGGKGMKIVENREEFVSQLESAKRESMKGFGDDTVLLEKYLSTPRLLITDNDPRKDVEVQIFSDTQGHHVSLFERDCSVQRRHQKIIEEAPAPGLALELRQQLAEKARKAAEAVGYVGAGTVEFIMDANNHENFYFMEMNTRLQVEHPVTEAITGVDLVQWQLEVAAGNPIPLAQSEITCTGHAFECRIYAENPRNNFLPDTGLLRHVQLPAPSPNVRMETGFAAGDEISVFYDPLIAKLIVHGSSRTEALRILRKALGEYQIVGPHTNIEFLKRLAEHESFIAADVETGFIQKHFDALFAPVTTPSPSTLAQAGLFVALRDLHATSTTPSPPWTTPSLAGFRTGGADEGFNRSIALAEPIEGGRTATVQVAAPDQSGSFKVNVVDFAGVSTEFLNVAPLFSLSSLTAKSGSTSISTLLADQLSLVDIVPQAASTPTGAEKLHLFNMGEQFVGAVEVVVPKWLVDLKGTKVGPVGSARAPMPSRIIQIMVKAGDVVDAGAPLCVVEAMKSELVLRAPKAGVVSRVIGSVGDLVAEGKVLVEFEEAEVVEGEAL